MGEFLDFVQGDFKYKLYIPSGYKPKKKAPLMVMLHGCEQDPDDFATGTKMNQLADQEIFLVLYPNMNHMFNPSDPTGYNPLGCWNWFLDKNQHRGMGHPKLIFEIINKVKSTYNINENRIYAAGLSAGGSLACILGVTYPDIFSGIAICSGLVYDAANVFFLTDPLAEDAKKSMEKGVPDPYAKGNSAFHEMGKYKRKMPVIVFHGLLDTTVHPINGQQVIIQWAQTNFLVEGGQGKVNVAPIHVEAGMINEKSYTKHVYGDRLGEPLLELWMIDQMGHTWSGGNPDGSYTDPEGPNATEIIWNFFKSQTKAAKKGTRASGKKDGASAGEFPMEIDTATPGEDPVVAPLPAAAEAAASTAVYGSGLAFGDTLIPASVGDSAVTTVQETEEADPAISVLNEADGDASALDSRKSAAGSSDGDDEDVTAEAVLPDGDGTRTAVVTNSEDASVGEPASAIGDPASGMENPVPAYIPEGLLSEGIDQTGKLPAEELLHSPVRAQSEASSETSAKKPIRKLFVNLFARLKQKKR